jgi:hypothetical protein
MQYEQETSIKNNLYTEIDKIKKNETNKIIYWNWSKGKPGQKSAISSIKPDMKDQIDSELLYNTKMVTKQKLSGQNEKLSQRDFMVQTSINPFINNDYLQHLDDQDSFLKPKNSNFE